MPSRKTDITLHAQALALLEEGIPLSRIIKITSYSKSSIYCIKQIAYERGYDPAVSKEFKDDFFVDAPCTSRPKVITEEKTAIVLEEVKKSYEGREMTSNKLGFKAGMSRMSALQVLYIYRLRKVKPIWKSGLTTEMRAVRYEFIIKYKD
jgi:hypothetical protein